MPQVGTAERALVAVTGPARRSQFDVRVPGQMRRFGRDEIREPVLLPPPPGVQPPQGAILDLIAEIRLPRGPRNGFDERPGSAVTACTPSFARTGGESSGAAAACPASRIGCARISLRGWLRVSMGSDVP